jgi:hypothetical protein
MPHDREELYIDADLTDNTLKIWRGAQLVAELRPERQTANSEEALKKVKWYGWVQLSAILDLQIAERSAKRWEKFAGQLIIDLAALSGFIMAIAILDLLSHVGLHLSLTANAMFWIVSLYGLKWFINRERSVD